MVNLASFWKPEACGQTVLPDRSVLIGQKLMENAKIKKFKCDILSNFQTMCRRTKDYTFQGLLNHFLMVLKELLYYIFSNSQNRKFSPLDDCFKIHLFYSIWYWCKVSWFNFLNSTICAKMYSSILFVVLTPPRLGTFWVTPRMSAASRT